MSLLPATSARRATGPPYQWGPRPVAWWEASRTGLDPLCRGNPEGLG